MSTPIVTSSAGNSDVAAELLRPSRARTLDQIYMALLFLASLAILALIVGIAVQLAVTSHQSLSNFGPSFLFTTTWDPNRNTFGAWNFILGTLYSSFWALLLAVPISVGAAIFLSEIAPPYIRTPLAFLIELLAAIPSVVYGLWGIFVLSPLLTNVYDGPSFTVFGLLKEWVVTHHIPTTVKSWISGDNPIPGLEPSIAQNHLLHRLPIFSGPPNGSDVMTASLILAIMVTPYITSVSRDILMAIPKISREGSYAVGATKWETITGVVLPYARAGIIGAVILGLGRALGETMAVTMVIGNSETFKTSLFAPGNTMASVIANEFSEASTDIYRSSLIEIGLCLFIVTMIVNGIARLLVRYTALDIQGGKR